MKPLAWNCVKCTKQSCLPRPTPMGMGIGEVNSKKCSVWNWMKYVDLHRKSDFLTPTPWGLSAGGANFENIFLGIAWHSQICTERSCLKQWPLWVECRVGDQLPARNGKNIILPIATPLGCSSSTKNLFCQELHEICRCVQEVIFVTPNHLGWMGIGGSVSNLFMLGIKWNVQICTEKSGLPTPPYGEMDVEGGCSLQKKKTF